MNIYDQIEDKSVMEDALKDYILPDNMDGHTSLSELIGTIKAEVKSNYTEDNDIIAKQNLPAFKRIWKNDPALFVEIIAEAWVGIVEDNVLMLLRAAKK